MFLYPTRHLEIVEPVARFFSSGAYCATATCNCAHISPTAAAASSHLRAARPPIGGAIASQQAQAADNAVAYCAQRFRSYDPASGTYLGYDGMRHPCP